MGFWGVYSDQNDNVSDVLCDLENDEEKCLLCIKCLNLINYICEEEECKSDFSCDNEECENCNIESISKKYIMCENCSDRPPHALNAYRSEGFFKVLIDLEKLKYYDDEIIIGVLVSFARSDNADILSNDMDFDVSLPKTLPDNYPQCYKDLANETFEVYNPTLEDLQSWANPQERFDTIQAERALFTN